MDIDNLNILQQFPSVLYTSCDFATFEEDKYFINFHYYEVFDETKQYSNTKFCHDYGKGLLNYQFCLYVIRDNNTHKKYVVVDEILTEKERLKLKDYCGCNYCMTDDIKRIDMDRNDYSCLADTHTELASYDQKVIDSAKERMKLGSLSVTSESESWLLLSIDIVCNPIFIFASTLSYILFVNFTM